MAERRRTPPRSRKSRAKGRTPHQQFATAQRRIEEAKGDGTAKLDLSGLTKLSWLPPELAALTALQILYLSGTQVSDLTPIAGLTALQSLYLTGTRVSDLEPIARLTALQSLNFNRTQVSNLTPIAGLTALQSLHLWKSQVSDLTPIAGLTALQSLDVSGTQISDLTPIAGLTALQSLYVSVTQVSDLTPIAGLTALLSLDVSGTQVRDLTPIAGLTVLEYLDLNGTQVSDLTPIAGLTVLEFLDLNGTQVRDLTPIAGLTVLEYLDLNGTQVSDLTPIAGLTALRGVDFTNTQVGDLTPIAGLTALESLNLTGTQVRDLTPIARLTGLLDGVASQNAMRRSLGLIYANSPTARKPPFDRLVLLEQPARTVETLNEARRQLGLPEHIPDGYERLESIPFRRQDDLEPPPSPLPTPGPATRFAVIRGRIDVVPPDAWRHQGDQAAIYHNRARQLAAELEDRLAKTDAVPDVAASVAALADVLGQRLEDVQPDLLRLTSRSIAARARAYGHPNAQWEISPESVSAIFELADLLVDLQSFARTEIEANERAIRQLDLTTEQAAAAKTTLDEISQALDTLPDIVTTRVEEAFANAAVLSATAADEDVALAIEGERILLTENLALSIARSMAGSGGAPPNEHEPPGQPPERPRRRPRKRALSHKGLTWDSFKERLLKRLEQKAPEAIADAALHAAVATIKNSPKTIAGLGAAIVVWSATGLTVAAGGGLALTSAWIGYLLAKHRQQNVERDTPHAQ